VATRGHAGAALLLPAGPAHRGHRPERFRPAQRAEPPGESRCAAFARQQEPDALQQPASAAARDQPRSACGALVLPGAGLSGAAVDLPDRPPGVPAEVSAAGANYPPGDGHPAGGVHLQLGLERQHDHRGQPGGHLLARAPCRTGRPDTGRLVGVGRIGPAPGSGRAEQAARACAPRARGPYHPVDRLAAAVVAAVRGRGGARCRARRRGGWLVVLAQLCPVRRMAGSQPAADHHRPADHPAHLERLCRRDERPAVLVLGAVRLVQYPAARLDLQDTRRGHAAGLCRAGRLGHPGMAARRARLAPRAGRAGQVLSRHLGGHSGRIHGLLVDVRHQQPGPPAFPDAERVRDVAHRRVGILGEPAAAPVASARARPAAGRARRVLALQLVGRAARGISTASSRGGVA